MSATSSIGETEPQRTAGTLDIEFSIVSGSREELLFDCIASLHEVMRGSSYSWQVTAICNAPGTDLPRRLRERFPNVRAIENTASRGFAANHNSVLTSSVARYLWLLNDDLVMLPDSVEKVTAFMERPENSRVAVVSPRLLNPDRSLQPSTYSFPTMPQIALAYSGFREHRATDRLLKLVAPLLRPGKGASRFWDHDATVVVDTLRGACVAVRMAAAREVGPMIEVALVGGEETEWHRRFKERGWQVVFFPEASVVHYGSQTVGNESRNLYPEYLKSALYFFKTSRPAPVFTAYCVSLIAMYEAQILVARLRRDAAAVELARRYASVAREAMRSPGRPDASDRLGAPPSQPR